MKHLVYILTFVFFLFGMANSSFAMDEYTIETNKCNIPRDMSLSTEDDKRWKYCNIYSRRFLYREKSIALREQLLERAKAYHEVGQARRDFHEKEIQEYHQSLKTESSQDASTPPKPEHR